MEVFRMVSSFLDPLRCLGLGLRQQQVRVTGAGPQHQHQELHGTPPCTLYTRLERRGRYKAEKAREAAETLSLVPPGRAPALGSCQDQQRQQPARTLDPACKQPLTV